MWVDLILDGGLDLCIANIIIIIIIIILFLQNLLSLFSSPAKLDVSFVLGHIVCCWFLTLLICIMGCFYAAWTGTSTMACVQINTVTTST